MTVRAVLAGLGTLLAVAVNQPIVHAVSERRPYTALSHVTLLVHRSTDASFPSDHATMAGAVAVGLVLTSWRLGLVAAALALLMAFARVYVGAHYPVDVGVGLEVGGIVAAATQLLAPTAVRATEPLLRTPLRHLLAA
jgi:undecaprenyl-diphosphatase